MEIAATGDAAARRMGSRASRPVESAKALHAKTAVMMLLNLKMHRQRLLKLLTL